MAIAGRQKRNWPVRVVCALLLSIIIGNALLLPTTEALTNVTISPDPTKFIPEGGSPPENYLHIIKRENTSDIDTLQMAAYFDAPSPTQVITITDRDVTGDRCQVLGNLPTHIRLTMTVQTPTGPSTVVYGIPAANICTGPTNTTNAYGSNNSRFFASYPVPAGFAPGIARDPTTNLYRVAITIRYDAAVVFGNASTTNRQQIVFRVRLNNCPAGTCTRYLSTVPIGAGLRNYSTTGVNNADIYSTQQFGFGLPCNVNASIVRTVNVYDVDNGWDWEGNGIIRRAQFKIERWNGTAWIALRSPEIVSVTGANGYNPGDTIIQPQDGSGQTTTVNITMLPQTNYRLSVDTMWNTNLLGIGLPEETIFGDLNCARNLNGRIDANPTTNPIEVGRDVTLSAIAYRTGDPDFNSQFTYTWRTWHDTGDSRYQAGETIGCAPQINVARTHSGTAPVTLANCTMRADTTRSGGNAVALCAQLIFVATDGTQVDPTVAAPNGLIRCIQIGKYPHLEARNGDVLAGGVFKSIVPTCMLSTSPVISSSQRLISGTYFSSYATYGVTSLGRAGNFGSQGLSYGSPTSNYLVFANPATDPGYFYNPNGSTGLPATPRCLNDPFSIFATRATSPNANVNVDISTLTQDTILTSATSIHLTASSVIAPGTKLVIYAPNANINIDSDIRYADVPYASINLIPQIVILTEQQLVIKDTVTQIDGILATKENLFTCQVTPRLHTCNLPLTINGAVLAGKKVVALRTTGAEAPTYTGMAETINLRQDMFLNQLPEAGGGNVYIKTVSETEVPPRF